MNRKTSPNFAENDSGNAAERAAEKRRLPKRAAETPIYRSFRCPHCRTDIYVGKDEVGTTVVCPDCDSPLVVPDYLDFTETDEERRRAAIFSEEKRRRDEFLSPLKNPNRIGIDCENADVYSFEGKSGENKYAQTDWLPVYCRVCGTLLHASRERLGLPIRCPDCGTETIATSSVRDKIRAQDAESTVAAPDPKTSGPALKIEAEPTKPKFAVSRSELGAAKFLRNKLVEPDENLPLTLRRRGDRFVWTLASPPKFLPLFNGVGRALGTPELWARGGLLAAFLAAVSTIVVAVFLPAFESFFARETMILAIVASATQMLAIYVWAILSTFFVSIYIAGNTGAKRVVDWLENGFWSDLLFGGWFFSIVAISLAPGGVVATLFNRGENEVFAAFFRYAGSNGVGWFGAILRAASFCFFFPIFFLSTLQKNDFFAPIFKSVVQSWRARTSVWIEFYLTTAFVAGVPIAVFFRFIDDGAVWLVASAASPIAIGVYALLLGRLSWILDDEIRSKEFDE